MPLTFIDDFRGVSWLTPRSRGFRIARHIQQYCHFTPVFMMCPLQTGRVPGWCRFGVHVEPIMSYQSRMLECLRLVECPESRLALHPSNRRCEGLLSIRMGRKEM